MAMMIKKNIRLAKLTHEASPRLLNLSLELVSSMLGHALGKMIVGSSASDERVRNSGVERRTLSPIGETAREKS